MAIHSFIRLKIIGDVEKSSSATKKDISDGYFVNSERLQILFLFYSTNIISIQPYTYTVTKLHSYYAVRRKFCFV